MRRAQHHMTLCVHSAVKRSNSVVVTVVVQIQKQGCVLIATENPQIGAGWLPGRHSVGRGATLLAVAAAQRVKSFLRC